MKKSSNRSAVKSTRDRMLERKKQIAEKSNGGNLNFIKEGTLRLRLKSRGDDEEIGLEIIHFYLGQKLGGFISPATFDEPCPLLETYKKLKDSKKESDQVLAKNIIPRRKYIIGGIAYSDEKGKEIDAQRIDKAWMVGRNVYTDIIDLFLDEDEWGDMTDPDEGYDIKITRSGKGQLDTNYTVTPCSKKPLKKEFQGEIDLEGLVRKEIKTFEDLQEIANQFTNSGDDEDDDEQRTSLKNKKKKKLRRSSDI